MSLQYSINSELYGESSDINKGYTFNVLISGIGIFVGPIITGLILDFTKKDYSKIFILGSTLYAIAIFSFVALKIILIKNKNNPFKKDYVEFENELY
jgi:hypothetical protein